jgi:hypothetical protein
MDSRKTVSTGLFLLVVLLLIQPLAVADASQSDPSKGQPAQTRTTSANAAKTDKTKAGNVNGSSVAVQVPKDTTAMRKMENVRIDDIDKNYASITITDCPPRTPGGPSLCNGDVMTLAVGDALRPELKAFQKRDHLKIDTDGKSVLSIGVRSVAVGSDLRSLVLGITLAVCFLLTTLLTWGHPLKLIIGQDGRYSNSKFQMAVWFWVLISTYLAVVYLRVSRTGWEFFGAVNIPQNLLLLSGMSALTFGGAKGITTTKANAAIAAGHANPKDSAGVHPNFWTDLVQNDLGVFDIGDFQMLMVTLLAVAMYFTLVFTFLGEIAAKASLDLPNVDTTILASFGLGQGAYLTKKAVGNPGQS